MSLGRRVALLMAAVVLLSLLGGLVVQTLVAREALQRELQRRSLEAAHSLAQVLAEQLGDTARMQALVVAQVELGSVRSIVLTRPDGVVILEASPAPRAPAVPGWFMSWLPLSGVTAHADILHGHRLGGSVRVEPRTAWAHEALWASARLTASWLAGVALFAATLSAYLLRGWQQPAAGHGGAGASAGAGPLCRGRRTQPARTACADPQHERHRAPAARSVCRTGRAGAGAAAAGPGRCRHGPCLCVAISPARLQAQLAEAGGPGAALILVRVLDLEALNQRLGHEATDRLLVSAAGLLLAYVDACRAPLPGG
jgi:hypothetical protein